MSEELKRRKKRTVEILSPAGSYECFRAALHAGADAVYAGGPRFGARAYAENFTVEELIRAIEEAHIFGKRFYLTVNTLLKDTEIDGLFEYLAPLYERGLDAVIVQDMGVLLYIKSRFPDMDIHASTQMTVTGACGAKFLEEQGVCRVVPARELSIEEVRQIRRKTGLEIECFVHGALCYCYSGQCLLSSMIGGRSGNRGQCAQPCRLAYTAGGEKKYFLSLKDICTLEMIPELIEAGIDSFKIEGRMKKPEYVAAVTAMYKKYTELYLEKGRDGFSVCPSDREALMDLYNRGDSGTGYYRRHNGREMIALERPNHAGVPAAKCLRQKGREVKAAALTVLHAGDVLETAGGKENYTLGSSVEKEKTFSFLVPKGAKFRKGYIFRRIRNGQLIKEIGEQYIFLKKQEKIYGFLSLSVGNPATLTVCCRDCTFTAQSEESVSYAQNRPLEKERVYRQLIKTGETEFSFETADIIMEENIFFPVQQLNLLRRNALAGLRAALTEAKYRALPKEQNEYASGALPCKKQTETPFSKKWGETPVSVLVETSAQLEAVEEAIESQSRADYQGNRIARVYPDVHMCGEFFESPEISDRLKRLKAAGIEIMPALPRILREESAAYMEEMYEKLKDFLLDGLLVRSYEIFAFLKQHGFDKKIILDHNLYVFNRYAKQFWKNHGITEYTASAELNKEELLKLGIRDAELNVYGRLPVMVSAQCVKRTHQGCTGKTGITILKDRYQKEFPVKNYCDLCYNVMYDASPLCLSGEKEEIERLSPCSMRISFTAEEKKEVKEVLRLFGAGEENKMGQRPESELAFAYTKGHFDRKVL